MSKPYSYCGHTANDGSPTFAVTGPGLPFCWGHDEPHCFKTPEEAQAIAGLMNRALLQGQKNRSESLRALLEIR